MQANKELQILAVSRIELVPENPKYRKITLNENMDFAIWGVVTGTYKSFK